MLANWRKTKRSQMKRKIHHRRNLRERKKRPGLENWKRCSDLHYMIGRFWRSIRRFWRPVGWLLSLEGQF